LSRYRKNALGKHKDNKGEKSQGPRGKKKSGLIHALYQDTIESTFGEEEEALYQDTEESTFGEEEEALYQDTEESTFGEEEEALYQGTIESTFGEEEDALTRKISFPASVSHNSSPSHLPVCVKKKRDLLKK
jgi:hypothetical protein